MTPKQLECTFATMQRFGGSFCKSLARTWMCGDPNNRSVIEHAFPNYLLKFGPNSPFYTEDIDD
jgi:hypothetical protein